MPRLGITDAFARYGATLRNPQWSVSAWAPDGSLVVSIWEHHYRKGPPETMEFADSLARWSGHGNREFRANLARAHSEGGRLRLVIVRASNTAAVDAGEDASKIPKEFFVRVDLVGAVQELDGDRFVLRFRRLS